MKSLAAAIGSIVLLTPALSAAENWPQLKYDSRHSGNAPQAKITTPLGLAAAIATTDAVLTAPAVADGRVFVVDASGVAFCIDASTHKVLWKTATGGGAFNCNNVSSPAVVGGYVHFGTTAGNYYVLDARDGKVVTRLACGDPIFSAPVVGKRGVYFATLGSRVFALSPEGKVRWKWDFVREVLKFTGDRWSGADWRTHKKGRVTWREQFLCSRNIALDENTLVIPAGGTIVWLQDTGEAGKLVGRYAPRESPATLGLSLGADGAVYQQWYRRDNTGRIEVLRRSAGKLATSFVTGTQTSWRGRGSMGVTSVSIRDGAVYRCRPEAGFGLCRHSADGKTTPLGGSPSIASPVLVGDRAVYGGLDGRLHVASLSDPEDVWSFRTAFGRPITAPAAVADGKVYFGCEDGYLYILAPGGVANTGAKLPTKDLELAKIRSPLTGKFTDARYDWFTSFGNLANTNVTGQKLALPIKLRWIRRVEGTVKHFSVCGGGRMYTHTAEGQIFAVEQETGRLLWRVYYPGVHVCYTSPIYHKGRLLVPQAGIKRSRLRCLDAATGRLIWEAPFSGSPSWNRQMPPVVHNGLVIYQFSTGRFDAAGWLFEHQSTFGFPKDHKPVVKAWDLATGKEKWTVDFSEHGAGGDDAGMCLVDGTLYYSCYFGRKDPPGVTAAIDPKSGKLLWKTTKYAVRGGCTICGERGRLYLGGYNSIDGKTNRVTCLDARDGSLVWQSDPIQRAIHVVTIAGDRLFTHAQYRNGYLLDKASGRKICELTRGYHCTRFTMDGRYLLGPNLDVIDTADKNKTVWSGPAVDVLQCIGAHVSGGRLMYTANGSGLQLSASFGEEAARFTTPWQRKPSALR